MNIVSALNWKTGVLKSSILINPFELFPSSIFTIKVYEALLYSIEMFNTWVRYAPIQNYILVYIHTFLYKSKIFACCCLQRPSIFSYVILTLVFYWWYYYINFKKLTFRDFKKHVYKQQMLKNN